MADDGDLRDAAVGVPPVGPLVEEVWGDQVRVNGRWYHAERVLGRPVATFAVGEPVPELAGDIGRPVIDVPVVFDPYLVEVEADLYRGNPDNVYDMGRVESFMQAMLSQGGWGSFPPALGYIQTVTLEDVLSCAAATLLGGEGSWLSERGWSRLLRPSDVGRQYVQLVEGHHRCAAACRVLELGCPALIQARDLGQIEADEAAETDRRGPSGG